MPQAYFQCRAARDASFQDKAVEISARSTLGIIEGGETARIGSFDRQDSSNNLCFSGSRVLRGGGGGKPKPKLNIRPGYADLHNMQKRTPSDCKHRASMHLRQ